MRCREALATAHALLDGRRPLSEDRGLADHLASCARCSAEVSGWVAVSRLAGSLKACPDTSTDRIRARVMATIRNQTPERSPRRRAIPAAVLAAVASVAVICVFVVGLSVGRGMRASHGAGTASIVTPEAPAPGPSSSTPAVPVFAASGGSGQGHMAESIPEGPEAHTAAGPEGAEGASSTPRSAQKASARKPVVPRGESVRGRSDREVADPTPPARSGPEATEQPERRVRVRYHRLEVPGLDMPLASPRGGDGTSLREPPADSEAHVILVVPVQEF